MFFGNKFSQNIVRRASDALGGGFSCCSSGAHSVPESSPKGAEKARLETNGKLVRRSAEEGDASVSPGKGKPSEKKVKHPPEDAHRPGRAARFRQQRHAVELLARTNLYKDLGGCRTWVRSKIDGVDLVRSRYEETGHARAHYEGLQNCGYVWACPCCSARISETRREELGRLLSWAREKGYRVTMVTMTARHGREDVLMDLLNLMKRAKQKWARHRAYGRAKAFLVGHVTATEVTGGGVHGWHPHFHVIFIHTDELDFDALRDAWLASLRGVGLEGTGAGWHVSDASETGVYLAKWGAAEELTLSGKKVGRGSGMTPFQLLAASEAGDAWAGSLFREFAQAFFRRNQLVWSRGLKDLAGVEEVTDADAARDDRQEKQVEVDRANIEHKTWNTRVFRPKRDRRSSLLDRAEQVGPVRAVEELEEGDPLDQLDRVVSEPDVEVIEPDMSLDDLLELVERPTPGGLAAQALAALPPRGSEFSPGPGIYSQTHKERENEKRRRSEAGRSDPV